MTGFSIFIMAIALAWGGHSYACDDDHHHGDDHHSRSHHGRHGRHNDNHSPRHDENHEVSISSKSNTLSGTVTMGVTGMMCSSCREKLEAAIKKIPEVATVQADVKAKTLTVTLKASLARSALESAIKDAGFSPR